MPSCDAGRHPRSELVVAPAGSQLAAPVDLKRGLDLDALRNGMAAARSKRASPNVQREVGRSPLDDRQPRAALADPRNRGKKGSGIRMRWSAQDGLDIARLDQAA